MKSSVKTKSAPICLFAMFNMLEIRRVTGPNGTKFVSSASYGNSIIKLRVTSARKFFEQCKFVRKSLSQTEAF